MNDNTMTNDNTVLNDNTMMNDIPGELLNHPSEFTHILFTYI